MPIPDLPCVIAEYHTREQLSSDGYDYVRNACLAMKL